MQEEVRTCGTDTGKIEQKWAWEHQRPPSGDFRTELAFLSVGLLQRIFQISNCIPFTQQ